MVASTKISDKSRPMEDAAPPKGAEIRGLAELFRTWNKISTRVQEAASSVNSEITITDWILLISVEELGEVSMAALARKVGITRQRVQQQSSSLGSYGLVSTADGDGKAKILKLTPNGKALLISLEAAIMAILSAGTGAVPTAAIATSQNSSKRILKSLATKREGENSNE